MKTFYIILSAFAFFFLFMFLRISSVNAQPPGGCAPVANNLATCNQNLDACLDDLAVCEYQGGQIFPGDGYPNPDAFGVSGHGPALSYTDNGDGTVTDNNTGFMWEKKTGSVVSSVECITAEICPDPHNVNNLYDWSDVGDDEGPDGTLFTVFTTQLNNACDSDPTVACNDDADCSGVGGPCGFAGYRDWCVPNIKQLESIKDYARAEPAINPIFGPTQVSDGYWSSTSLPDPNGFVALVYFDMFNNYVSPIGIKEFLFFARAMRPCP